MSNQPARENHNTTAKLWHRLGLGLALAVLVFIGLNYGYFWAQIKYVLWPPAPIQTSTNVTPTLQLPKGEPDILQIDSLNLSVPVIYVNEQSEKVFQAALQNGVVHYPGTAMPGEYGNDYIFGHSSDYIWSSGKYKTVFAVLPRIKLGAEIKLSNSSGDVFLYIVTLSKVVDANDVSWLSQGDRTKKLLTLQTSYPLGTALRRWIVQAEMSVFP